MAHIIETIDEALAVTRSVLSKYLTVVKNKNVEHLDLSALISSYQKSFPPYIRRTEKEKLDVELTSFIKNIRNLKSHEKDARMVLINNPCFVATSLEIIRLFIEPLIAEINKVFRKNLEGHIFEMPEFLHVMNQPDGSRFKPDASIDWKTKSFDYVTTRKAPFNLTNSPKKLTRHTAKEILTWTKYFKNGTKILMVRTVGHIFLFDREGNGHSGDWEDPNKQGIDVDNIVIVHFYEGKESSKAHVYLADVYERELKNFYTTPRYRYCFSNLKWCGEIKANFVDDFHSLLFFNIEY